MSKRKPTKSEILAAAIAQIHIGVAMARASGVVCGSPQDIRVYEVKTDG
ncbi:MULTISPECIES: hypothetical protein [unclassified Mesorhizobium]|nr:MULTISPECIES: hypothetical protein [unclassified Mesorhizobium]